MALARDHTMPHAAPAPRARMTVLTVRHVTTYRYRQPVALGEHRMMLRPRDSADQRLIEHRLRIDPEPAALRSLLDVHGNCVAVARFAGRATRLVVDSTLVLDHAGAGNPGDVIAEHARALPFAYDAADVGDLARAMEPAWPDPAHAVGAWARGFLRAGRPSGTLAVLSAMTQEIHRGFAYLARHEPGIQDPAHTLRVRTGTCRDFAALMMEAARSLGLAARFVSGYLNTRDREACRGGGNTHAWMQAYLPGAGWVEFDPTNGLVASADLIRVAVVRDPAQAVPLAGTFTGFPHDCLGMEVSVFVTSDLARASA